MTNQPTLITRFENLVREHLLTETSTISLETSEQGDTLTKAVLTIKIIAQPAPDDGTAARPPLRPNRGGESRSNTHRRRQ